MIERFKWEVVIGVLGYLTAHYLGGGGLSQGEPAPDFTVPTLSGEPFVLSEHRGSVIALDFWASWCPPCKASLPALQRVHEQYRDDASVRVVSVNTDRAEFQDRGLEVYMKRSRFSFPVLFDRQMRISQIYGVQSIPTFVVVRADGVVHSVERGLPAKSVPAIADHIVAQIEAARASK